MAGAFEYTAFENTAFEVSPPQTLSPPLVTNVNVFYPAIITQTGGTQTLLAPFFENANTFYSLTVSLAGAAAGAGMSARRGKGWANERAALERSLQKAELPADAKRAAKKLAKSERADARQIASKIYDYSQEAIDLDRLGSDIDELERQLIRNNQYAADIEAALQDTRKFMADEQEAIDLLLMVQQQNAQYLLAALRLI